MTAPPHTMDEFYTFVAVDRDGTETVVGVRANESGSSWQPLIATSPDKVEDLKPFARRIADELHQPVKLIRFTHREELPL